MDKYYLNLEEKTILNDNYRKVILTTKHQQLVLMSLLPNEEIGSERHNNDQFIELVEGELIISINSTLKRLKPGNAVMIPANSLHNVLNSGKNKAKLYTIYSPPHHPDGLIQKYKSD